MKKHILNIVMLFASFSIFGQHDTTIHTSDSPDLAHKKIVQGASILYGSILLPEHNDSGEKIGHTVLPSVSVDYELWYNHKVGVLVMNEFVLNSFEVVGNDGEFIKRESILISALALGFSPFKHFETYIGGGYEIDLTNGSKFSIMRAGVAYGIPIRNNWVSILALAGDFRKNYSSVSFEIGFGKFF